MPQIEWNADNDNNHDDLETQTECIRIFTELRNQYLWCLYAAGIRQIHFYRGFSVYVMDWINSSLVNKKKSFMRIGK